MLTIASRRGPRHVLRTGLTSSKTLAAVSICNKQMRISESLILQRSRTASTGIRIDSSAPVKKQLKVWGSGLGDSWKSKAEFSVVVTAAAAVAAAAAGAVTAVLLFEGCGHEGGGNGSVASAAIRELAKVLCLTTPTSENSVGCAYRRRIQDMYRLVDNPVGQGVYGTKGHEASVVMYGM